MNKFRTSSVTRSNDDANSSEHAGDGRKVYSEVTPECLAILEGYKDAIRGNLVPFNGNLRSLCKKELS